VEAFFFSTAVVGLAEIGDRTQILSLLLAARFQRPVPIILGILFATLANHAAAGALGTFFGSWLSGPWMRWILGISFLSVAVWALFPDKYEGDDEGIRRAVHFCRRFALSSSPRSVTRPRSPRSAWPRGSRPFTRSSSAQRSA
jgi:putative Ca2+/H+ antiporter (TMEM165/GDT1 family)